MFAFDENSPVPLTLSFQHVQFNKGGVRNAIVKACCIPSFAWTNFSSQHETVRASAMSTREERQCWFSPARKTRASSLTTISR